MNALFTLSDRDIQLTEAAEPAVGGASSTVVNMASRVAKPAWEREVLSRVCSFIDLPPDWDSYGGKPLRRDTAMFALQVLSAVMTESLPLPSVVPVGSGGVQFEWHENGLDIELYVAAPYECELSVYDHYSCGAPVTKTISTDPSPLGAEIRRLVDYNRHLQSLPDAG